MNREKYHFHGEQRESSRPSLHSIKLVRTSAVDEFGEESCTEKMAWSFERIRCALEIVAFFEQQKIALYDL